MKKTAQKSLPENSFLPTKKLLKNNSKHSFLVENYSKPASKYQRELPEISSKMSKNLLKSNLKMFKENCQKTTPRCQRELLENNILKRVF
ncbi:24449_t:CDS:2 [Cetraspora pellucida]|uniref:24449_t:CDS:1 n=1 Tax=Cetraspora pellucida TaxID=1433469 RepID=A0A9N9DY49_9GLOM|nr:24449_t:CDS:2 [Cetraspora pellucida]